MTLSPVPPPTPDNVEPLHQNVIDLLTDLLDDATNGSVRSVAIAIERQDGTTQDMWATGSNAYPVRLLGAIELLKIRFASSIVTKE